jgi:RNA polymerase sigma factor (sigma-70 family)
MVFRHPKPKKTPRRIAKSRKPTEKSLREKHLFLEKNLPVIQQIVDRQIRKTPGRTRVLSKAGITRDDVVNEVVIRMMIKGIESYDPSVGRLRPFLTAVIANEIGKMVQREIRHQWGRVSLPELSHDDYSEYHSIAGSQPTPFERIIQEERRHELQKLFNLAKLTPRQREVVKLRILDGKTIPQIAARMGSSSAAINAIFYRAMTAIREEAKRKELL